MKNILTEDKYTGINDISLKNIPNNKSYKSYSEIINSKLNDNNNSINYTHIPKKIFFNINGQDFNFHINKDINSYLYINSERKKISVSNLHLKTEAKSVGQRKKINKSQYYLPVLMEKKIDKTKITPYLKESNPHNRLGALKVANIYQIKNINLKNNNENINNNSLSLDLNKISNNKNVKLKKNNFRYNYNNSNDKKYNRKFDDYLEKIKNHRKKLKEQMIKRYRVQYSPHYFKTSNNEKENNKFSFNYDNPYLNNMNENVNEALNIFYGKIPNSKVTGYDKAFLKYSNDSTEKYLSNYNDNKRLNTFNIKLKEKNKNNNP